MVRDSKEYLVLRVTELAQNNAELRKHLHQVVVEKLEQEKSFRLLIEEKTLEIKRILGEDVSQRDILKEEPEDLFSKFQELKIRHRESSREIQQLRMERDLLIEEKKEREGRLILLKDSLHSILSDLSVGQDGNEVRMHMDKRTENELLKRALWMVKSTARMVETLEGEEEEIDGRGAAGFDGEEGEEEMIRVLDAELKAIWRGYWSRVMKTEDLKRRKETEHVFNKGKMEAIALVGCFSIVFLIVSIAAIAASCKYYLR
ncbi:uncharacterized protein LOC131235456 [Magnolia sinica]|uniref:uncharacterized protein LOC131235456 n=1 Tax=Magnolia sinica TaxID=86752 RepID=UPI00265876A5|nr:uncharacterized protein LOC131235456 [Magnolia sinica]XP_058088631.1 uncharacterized protein LOC131235456 [Magnolia sinica]XP_058088635.1 uncharacterized protein LOC131235456 [Magnolia sinica]XP_058088641.1 uncharacterized protein LOC131235456 [Magnolia sinica]